MVGKKGFIHVVEAVLVSVIAISMFLFIVEPFSISEDWSQVKMEKTAEDVLLSLDKNGTLEHIMEYNRSNIQERVDSVIGHRAGLEYNIRTENAYKNKIRIGFNCTECDVRDEQLKIERKLKPPYVNGREIDLQVFSFHWQNLTRYDIDVVLLNGKEQTSLARSHSSKVQRFLSGGNGIVEYSNLENNDLGNFRRDVFGLEDGQDSTDDIEFSNSQDVGKKNYEPYKLFYGVASVANVSGGPDTWDGKWTVREEDLKVELEDVSEGYNISINQTTCDNCKVGETFQMDGNEFTIEGVGDTEDVIYGDQMLIWIRHEKQPQDYYFKNFVNGPEDGDIAANSSKTVLETSDGNEAAFVINDDIGRSAWVSRGSGDDVKAVLTSAVIWSAGEGWWNYLKSPGDDSVTVSHFVSKNGEMYKTHKVVMTMWNIY